MKQSEKLMLLIIGVFFLLALLIFRFGTSYYTDYLWYQSQEQTDIWWKIMSFRVSFYIIGSAAAMLCYLGNFMIITGRLLEHQFYMSKALFWIYCAVAMFVSLTLHGGSFLGFWQDYLLALYAPDYGLNDPIFGLDASFYMFRLTLFQGMTAWLQTMLFLSFLFALGGYLLPISRASFSQRPRTTLELIRIGTPHLATMAALFVLLMALNSYLSRFDMIIEGSSDKVAGASYVDVHARNYGRLIFAYLGLFFAAVLAASGFLRSYRPPIYVMGVWIVAYISLVQLYPAIINIVQVNPNQFKAERDFIEHSITYTREGYRLSHVDRTKLTLQGKLDSATLDRNRLIIDNIRLWDYRPIRATFRQLQEIRQYYQFVDVDVDRYTVDGGMRQVMIAAREINKNNLPQRTRTWESRHLQYTHGYGVAMAPSNHVTPEGLPQLWIRDFPPQTFHKDLPKVERPAIYYGEISNDYVVVNTSLKEIDYPLENGFAETTYSGEGGVPLGSGLRRLALAWSFDFWKLLVSKYIDEDSRILFNRNIHTAVRKLAPFLHFDLDPYIVLADDGDLYWIMDAYTTSEHFPYSARFEKDSLAAVGTLGKQQHLRSLAGINYIRNSVKVTINAYNGKINFYLFDEDDPTIRAWQRFFPQLIKPLSEMPPNLLAHIRYPESLFMVQAALYTDYHMSNPQAFYNLEDRWQIATELYSGNPQQMEPYYTVIKLPGSQKEEYILMLPFIPNNKDNMIAWMAARCDYRHRKSAASGEGNGSADGNGEGAGNGSADSNGEGAGNGSADSNGEGAGDGSADSNGEGAGNGSADGELDNPYGELLLFEFPRTRQIYGPIQIESRIDQDPEISKDLTLWNQQGSRVIRGNLLVIPIEETLLYVEPIYLQSTNSPFPELRRVIAADSNSVVMGEDLHAALYKLAQRTPSSLNSLKLGSSPPSGRSGIALQPPGKDADDQSQSISLPPASPREAQAVLKQAEAAAARGNWSEFGQQMDRLKEILNQLQR